MPFLLHGDGALAGLATSFGKVAKDFRRDHPGKSLTFDALHNYGLSLSTASELVKRVSFRREEEDPMRRFRREIDSFHRAANLVKRKIHDTHGGIFAHLPLIMAMKSSQRVSQREEADSESEKNIEHEERTRQAFLQPMQRKRSHSAPPRITFEHGFANKAADKAASKIQCIYRGRMIRRQVALQAKFDIVGITSPAMEVAKLRAVIRIHAVVIGHLSRIRYRKTRLAVIQLQAKFRQVLVRRHFLKKSRKKLMLM